MNRLLKLTALCLVAVSLLSCGKADNKIKPTKNVVFMVMDGCSTSSLSLARWYKQYYGQNTQVPSEEGLNLDPYICGLMRHSHLCSPIVGSAGSMTSLMCGELVNCRNIGMYPKPSPSTMHPVDSTRAYQPLCNVAEVLGREKGKSLGAVVTCYFNHATPAATFAHADSRNRYDIIASQIASTCDVCFGGGTARLDEKARKVLKARDIPLITDDFDAFRQLKGDKAWALFYDEEMSYEIDRPTQEPSLAEMTTKALEMLSRNPKGFFLMVEGSKIDFAAHANDARTMIGDILAFDEAVKVVLDFAKKDGNTTVIITTDHGTAGPTLGNTGFKNYSDRGLDDALGEMPNYRISTSLLSQLLLSARPVSSIRDTISKYTGISITTSEEMTLYKVCNVVEQDYMQVSNTWNIQSCLGEILSSRAHVGFVSGNHTGEDVFYAVYNPRGQRPEGHITNIQMNDYLCAAAGLPKSVRDYTPDYYTRYTEVFDKGACSYIKDENGDFTLKVKLKDGRILELVSNTSIAHLDGKTVILPTPTVYVPKIAMFYVSKSILEDIDRAEKVF